MHTELYKNMLTVAISRSYNYYTHYTFMYYNVYCVCIDTLLIVYNVLIAQIQTTSTRNIV